MNSTELLSSLVEAVERSGVDIAPTYHEYMPMAFGIANSCGEQGRALFHRLCAPSSRYVAKEADRLFDNALRSGRNDNSLGTVWHLAERAGVDLKGIARPANYDNYDNYDRGGTPHTRARTLYNDSPDEVEEGLPDEGEEDCPAATFAPQDWPAFIRQGLDCGATAPQRDVLLLSMLTTLGATMADLTGFYYGNRLLHPCLQVFFIAPPASGKGVMGWAKHLAAPIHNERMRSYEQACAIYRNEKMKWDTLGKERASQPEPERPKRKLFFISGDNTGTGILENLIDQEGMGMISEAEASVLSAAISSDYGNWSHTLRKAFDHDGLSYNRRTNYEHRECAKTLLTVLVSGTPGQLRPLIPSAENGLFSRQLFYHMPPITEWVSQFHVDNTDYNARFEAWGERWLQVMKALRVHVSRFTFVLTREQEMVFDARLAQLFRHGSAVYGAAMRSAVARIAINLLRLMNIVALLRVVDPLLMMSDEAQLAAALERPVEALMDGDGLQPAAFTPSENVKDGTVTSFSLGITEGDYRAVMALAEPLYRHSVYALGRLPKECEPVRATNKVELFLASLPMEFTRQQALECARTVGLTEKSCDRYLLRLIERGTIDRKERGEYRFRMLYQMT